MDFTKLLELLFANKDYIFAALFVYMLYYVLKTNDAREKNYQAVIRELTEHIGVIKAVSEKVDKIEVKVEEFLKGVKP